jgi:hypothetical protein
VPDNGSAVRPLRVRTFLVAATAGLILASTSEAIDTGRSLDRGRSYGNPPTGLSKRERNWWKVEWSVCYGPMADLASDPDVHISITRLSEWKALSPQYAASQLAYFVELRTNTDDHGNIVWPFLDGCRNGLLKYYYAHSH